MIREYEKNNKGGNLLMRKFKSLIHRAKYPTLRMDEHFTETKVI